jgi:hypothetical protein
MGTEARTMLFERMRYVAQDDDLDDLFADASLGNELSEYHYEDDLLEDDLVAEIQMPVVKRMPPVAVSPVKRVVEEEEEEAPEPVKPKPVKKAVPAKKAAPVKKAPPAKKAAKKAARKAAKKQ